MNCLLVLALCVAAATAGIPDGYAHGRYAFYGRYGGKYTKNWYRNWIEHCGMKASE